MKQLDWIKLFKSSKKQVQYNTSLNNNKQQITKITKNTEGFPSISKDSYLVFFNFL